MKRGLSTFSCLLRECFVCLVPSWFIFLPKLGLAAKLGVIAPRGEALRRRETSRGPGCDSWIASAKQPRNDEASIPTLPDQLPIRKKVSFCSLQFYFLVHISGSLWFFWCYSFAASGLPGCPLSLERAESVVRGESKGSPFHFS